MLMFGEVVWCCACMLFWLFDGSDGSSLDAVTGTADSRGSSYCQGGVCGDSFANSHRRFVPFASLVAQGVPAGGPVSQSKVRLLLLLLLVELCSAEQRASGKQGRAAATLR